MSTRIPLLALLAVVLLSSTAAVLSTQLALVIVYTAALVGVFLALADGAIRRRERRLTTAPVVAPAAVAQVLLDTSNMLGIVAAYAELILHDAEVGRADLHPRGSAMLHRIVLVTERMQGSIGDLAIIRPAPTPRVGSLAA